MSVSDNAQRRSTDGKIEFDQHGGRLDVPDTLQMWRSSSELRDLFFMKSFIMHQDLLFYTGRRKCIVMKIIYVTRCSQRASISYVANTVFATAVLTGTVMVSASVLIYLSPRL